MGSGIKISLENTNIHQLTNPSSLQWWQTNSSAKDELTSQPVAIKKIMKPFSTPVLSKRTYRELKLLKHLKHENVWLHINWGDLRSSKDCRLFFVNLYPKDDQTDKEDSFCTVHFLDYQLERYFHFPPGGHVRTITELETWTDWTTQTLLLTLDFLSRSRNHVATLSRNCLERTCTASWRLGPWTSSSSSISSTRSWYVPSFLAVVLCFFDSCEIQRINLTFLPPLNSVVSNTSILPALFIVT